jgi:DNA polymerase elongation subunit (family B)
MKTYTFDIETYVNYTLFAFREVGGKNKLKTFEIRGEDESLDSKQIKKITKLCTKNKIITYNGLKFDEPITVYALRGKTAYQIFQAVQALIVDEMRVWQFYKKINDKPLIKNHIDIMDVARGSASLKLYGSRLGTKKLQDLPYEPNTQLTKKQMDVVLKYCENDNILTEELYQYLTPDLELRESMSEQYSMDFMSFKGAKIAEMILVAETNYDGGTPERPDSVIYKPPKYLKFKTPKLKKLFKQVVNHEFIVSDTGSVVLPDFLKDELMFDDLPYKFGIGGLHASLKSTAITPEDDEAIVDIDYKSLYPSIIIENNFSPRHIGKKFEEVYKDMYYQRNSVLKPMLKTLEYGSEKYKEVDRQQDTMKLVLNSSFGQTGQRFSKIYDPWTMLSTTLTGQFTLMMVVEMLSKAGFKTFYANTDGITLKVKKKDIPKVQKITRDFDTITGLEMEYNFFKASYLRDVNNFVNITDDDKIKCKGAYGEVPNLEKNVQTPIAYEAVKQYLLKKTPLEKTIKSCKDVTQFVSARTVTGGAIWSDNIPEIYPEGWEASLVRNKRITKKMDNLKAKAEGAWVKDNGKYLGKVVRWYYSEDGKPMFYKKSGNRVPKSDFAIPLMDLPKGNKIPKNLNYDWYITEAIELLKDVGVEL